MKAAIKKLGQLNGAGKMELFGVSYCNLAAFYQQSQNVQYAFNTAEQSRAKLEPYVRMKNKYKYYNNNVTNVSGIIKKKLVN